MKNKHTIAILAYNNHDLTLKNIKELVTDGYNNILLYDNGSNPSYRPYIEKYNIQYYREKKNIYVNPAWNKLFDMVQTKYLTLLNNDCYIISKNYFLEVIKNMEDDNIILSSCKTINKKNNFNLNRLYYYKLFFNYFYNKQLKYTTYCRRQGWLMTINLKEYKKLEYKIPDYIKIWFGDDWIWSQIIKNKRNYAVYKNRYAIHIRNKTIIKSEIQKVLEIDKIMMDKKGKKWIENSIYLKSRMFNRYI